MHRHIARHHHSDLDPLLSAPTTARGAVDTETLKAMAGCRCVIGVIAGSVTARYAPERLFKIVFVMRGMVRSRRACCFGAYESWKFGDDLPKGPLMKIYGLFVGTFIHPDGDRRWTVSQIC